MKTKNIEMIFVSKRFHCKISYKEISINLQVQNFRTPDISRNLFQTIGFEKDPKKFNFH